MKNIMVTKLTDKASQDTISDEEKTLLDFMVELEPNLFADMANYWLYTCFISSQGYSTVLQFLLAYYENNSGLALYDNESFGLWLGFI